MISRPKRLAIAAFVPFIALWLAAWFDGNVVSEAVAQAGQNYDIAPASLAYSVSYLIAMGGGLAVAAVAWWIRDQIVGLVYLVVGGFILFDGFLAARLAWSVNGAPPAAPAPPSPPGRCSSATPHRTSRTPRRTRLSWWPRPWFWPASHRSRRRTRKRRTRKRRTLPRPDRRPGLVPSTDPNVSFRPARSNQAS